MASKRSIVCSEVRSTAPENFRKRERHKPSSPAFLSLLSLGILCLSILTLGLQGQTAFAMSINEIMYNPPGSDNNREFVEIYFSGDESGDEEEGTRNLSGYLVGDTSSNDTMELLQLLPSSPFALIVEEGFNYAGINASIYSAGATIGNNLNNNEDTIYLYYSNGTLIDFVTYTSSWGGDSNNRSLERLANGTWRESLQEGGTPGAANSAPCEPQLANTSWSEWSNSGESGLGAGNGSAECLINDTSVRKRSREQYDLNNCLANETLRETEVQPCDFCTPSWKAVNSSCQADDSRIQWHNDTNQCHSQTKLSADLQGQPANVSHSLSCDYDGDGFIGNVSHLNTTLNLSVAYNDDTGEGFVFFRDNGRDLVQLPYNISAAPLLLSDITVLREENASRAAWLIVAGLPALNPAGSTNGTKAVFLPRHLSGNSICIHDSEISDSSNISKDCSGENETQILCDGTVSSGYQCGLIANNSRFKITGLRHSGVREMNVAEAESGEPEPATPDSGDSASDSSGSVGSSSGGGGNAGSSCPPGTILKDRQCRPVEQETAVEEGVVDGAATESSKLGNSENQATSMPGGERVAGNGNNAPFSSAGNREGLQAGGPLQSITGAATGLAAGESSALSSLITPEVVAIAAVVLLISLAGWWRRR